MPESGRLSAVQAASPVTGLQRTFKTSSRLLGRRHLGSRLEQFSHQPIRAITLALEIRAMTSCHCFKPDDFRPQLRIFRDQGKVVCRTTAPRSRRMPYLGKIDRHHRLATIRKAAWEPVSLGERPSSRRRDFQPGGKCVIGQRLNGHRLDSEQTRTVLRLSSG